ncbi:MurR/RpiR family transcriptional regulator [Oceanobacillus halotolerans]|uniref:MurR/RpiR family transcriptional regulator n=1 Tax=Oceanobacillus halotolerans TaxID=2663380 RepID=UPI0013DC020F|nr:MurR/RpiR family transcriptional regulator [Oceanobacillus halotolerans]
MDKIFNNIKQQQANFSKGLKKTATHFFHDPKVFAVKSAAQAGKQIGVSETTVIRFANEIGYTGYRALQEDVQHHLFQKSSLSDYLEPKITDNPNKHSVKSFMQNDSSTIQAFAEHMSEQDLEMAVTKLAQADQRLVAGVRSSHAMASWFAFALDLILGNTRLYQPTTDDVLLRISDLTKNSVVIVFSFHRYAVDSLHIAKLAKQQGAFVLAFTDTFYAPITDIADLSLHVQLNVKSTLDAAPVVFSLMNGIISSISLRNTEDFQQRVKQFDAMNAEDFFA